MDRKMPLGRSWLEVLGVFVSVGTFSMDDVFPASASGFPLWFSMGAAEMATLFLLPRGALQTRPSLFTLSHRKPSTVAMLRASTKSKENGIRRIDMPDKRKISDAAGFDFTVVAAGDVLLL